MNSFQPLAGVRVLDWTEGVAGPYACQMLGDLGADVIKIERPAGDWARGLGSPLEDGTGAQFVALNRNKRNICLDVKSAGGMEVARALIKSADIMITSYRPGVMEKLGLGFDQVRQYNPNLIYGRISGYGYEGALSKLPGSDTVLQAISGFMSQIGEPDSVPFRVGFPILDHSAARDLVIGVLSALLSRAKGEVPEHPVDVNLLATSAALQAQQWQEFLLTGKEPTRTGNRNPALAPAGVYETKDKKYISIAVLREEHWRKFCTAVKLTELEADPRFCANSLRVENRDQLESIVEPLIRERTQEDWLRILHEHDLLVAPVNTVDQVYKNDDLFGSIPKTTVPIGNSGTEVTSIGLPFHLGHQSASRARRGPAAKGANTYEILREIAVDDVLINEYIANEVVMAAGEEVQAGHEVATADTQSIPR